VALPESSVVEFPTCHLAHVRRPEGRGTTAVWICEYPYRSMRASGPSSECSGCPIWQAMQRERGASPAAEEVEILEAMVAS
jgi:hypothetical protein